MAISGSKPAPFPGFIEFCLPTLSTAPPSGREWLHEIKFDGFRIQAHLDRGSVRIFSRNGHDWTDQYPTIATAVAALPVATAILDGEAVVQAPSGISDFQALRSELARRNSVRLLAQSSIFSISMVSTCAPLR
jgi:bifunctional non-homologous end joining protein LigD